MDFPQRIKQHKAESDSYAILLYKLRELGIFRNATENDYGIDFEIELVEDDRLLGKYLKAQVKSSQNLTIRAKDSVPTVGGIKQSTLAYWAELSHKTHVIAYAVDISTENIYVSLPLFWQAIQLIDGTDSTKTIEFIKHDDEHHHLIPAEMTKLLANSPSLMDEIYCHKMVLKQLKQFLDLYADVFHYDSHMPIDALDTFQTFLEVSSILLWPLTIDYQDLTLVERHNLFSYSYWESATEVFGGGEDVSNFIAQKPLKVIMPALLNILRKYETKIFKSKYYWSYKSVTYLKLVYDKPIPEAFSHEEIAALSYNGINYSRKDGGFEIFLSHT